MLRQDGNTKMAEKNVDWNEATTSGNFVRIVGDEQKTLVISQWKLERVEKFGEQQIEFSATVTEEDGEKCNKIFSTTSTRLKKKLREILEKRDANTSVKISVLRVGDQYSIQYSVKVL